MTMMLSFDRVARLPSSEIQILRSGLLGGWDSGTGVNVCGECVGWWEEFK